MDHCIAIVLAGGSGKRMKSDIPKQYLPLKGLPLLFYSLKTFEDSFIDEIILVTAAGEESYCRENIVEAYGLKKVTHIVAGGKERYHSVMKGLSVIDECDYVFIHDGARPFVSQEILERAYQAVKQYRGCVVGVPVKDTIKITDKNGFVEATPDREKLYQVQTPQVFSYDLIHEAYDQLARSEQDLLEKGIHITDDSMIVEQILHQKVKMTDGSYENIKITTSEDLLIAENLVK